MIDGELISLGPHKPFQALKKNHNLLSVLRLGSGQPLQRFQLLCLSGGVLGACSIIHHHNLVFEIGRGSGQLWQVSLPFPYGSMFRIACLNDQINAVLLSAIRRDFGQPVQIFKKKNTKNYDLCGCD